MSINTIGSNAQPTGYVPPSDVNNEKAQVTNTQTTQTTQTTQQPAEQQTSSQIVEQNSAAVYEKSADEVATKQKVDPAEVDRLLKESQSQAERFRKLLESLLTKQADKNALANGTNRGSELTSLTGGILNGNAMVEVDEATRLQAQQDISEDGYYGVKQTSDRILSFAEALSGGDPKKLEEMRSAAMKGFDEAEKVWGDKLPQISQDTRDAVVKGFEELAKKFSG